MMGIPSFGFLAWMILQSTRHARSPSSQDLYYLACPEAFGTLSACLHAIPYLKPYE